MSQSAAALLIIAVVAAFFAASAIWRSFLDRDTDVSGRILRPGRGGVVTQPLRVEGELSSVPRGHHVWLAFEVRGLLYPVEPEPHGDDGHFAFDATSKSPEEPFSLVLMLVGTKGQRAIEYWLLEGGLGEGFPGFDRIPGVSELDRVQGLAPDRDSEASTAESRLAPPS
ncbi:MAG: hypothetical protein WBQ14_06425 [Gaiellaceae bacterium]